MSKRFPPPPIFFFFLLLLQNLDDETSGALNGGAAPVLVNDLESSAHEPLAANIARGESFVSSPMYV